LFEIKDRLKLDIVEVENKKEAFLDGGDVCFTGLETLLLNSKFNQVKKLI
jgi:hypothetical protein